MVGWGYVSMSGERNHVYFEKIAYPQCHTTFYSPELLNETIIKQMLQCVEQTELPFTADSTINWYNHFGKHWVIYTNTEHKHTPQPNSSTTRYRMYHAEMYTCVPKVMYKSIL